jgi:nucleoside-diphosphate-sugar epimerase
MSKILVVGGAGYVGPVLISRLKAGSPDRFVGGIDAGWFADQCDGIGPLPEVLYDDFRFVDVRDVTAEHLSGYDSVVYLAAISNDPMGSQFGLLTSQINRHEAARLATLARQTGARNFVLASSASVYGRGDGDRTETSSLDPQTDYARSKLGAESDIGALARPGFRVTSLRFATACGWSPRVRLDLVLNDFVASALTTGCIAVLSDGSPWRPLIHVEDMARAVEWALSEDRDLQPDNVVVNVGSAQWNFQIKQLADAVADVLGGVSVSVNSKAAPDTRSYRLDFSLWQRIAPRHQPEVTLEAAIQELATNLSEGPSRVTSDFRTSARIRLKRLQELIDAGFLDRELRWAK